MLPPHAHHTKWQNKIWVHHRSPWGPNEFIRLRYSPWVREYGQKHEWPSSNESQHPAELITPPWLPKALFLQPTYSSISTHLWPGTRMAERSVWTARWGFNVLSHTLHHKGHKEAWMWWLFAGWSSKGGFCLSRRSKYSTMPDQRIASTCFSCNPFRLSIDSVNKSSWEQAMSTKADRQIELKWCGEAGMLQTLILVRVYPWLSLCYLVGISCSFLYQA